MPPLPVSVARWTTKGVVSGTWSFQNILHVLATPTGIPDGHDVSELHGELITFWLFFWGAVASRDATLGASRFDYMSPVGIIRDDARLDDPGTNSSADVAASAACFVWSSLEGGRGTHGRTFIAGLPKTAYASGVYITDPPGSGWQAAANSFLANVNGFANGAFNDVKLVVLRQISRGVKLEHPYVAPIVRVRLTPRVCTQVNRLKHAQDV